MELNHALLVYAIVLTWNSGDALTCLSSLRAQDYPRLHVLVIDNGSANGTPQRVAASFPGVELLCLERNYGFAAANNIGIRRALAAGAGYVLLLNDDTRLEPDAIALLTAAAAADPRLGIVGPAIVSWQNPAIVYLGGRIDWRAGDGRRSAGYARDVGPTTGGRGICAGLCAADQGRCHPSDRAAGGKLFRLL
jgi:GT2 family glycosyltransferase